MQIYRAILDFNGLDRFRFFPPRFFSLRPIIAKLRVIFARLDAGMELGRKKEKKGGGEEKRVFLHRIRWRKRRHTVALLYWEYRRKGPHFASLLDVFPKRHPSSRVLFQPFFPPSVPVPRCTSFRDLLCFSSSPCAASPLADGKSGIGSATTSWRNE